jgi:D-alanyl-D-alanine carboxypeptidase
LFTGRILSEPILDRMETFNKAPDEHYPEQTGYGLGVRKMMIDGEQLVGHTGTIGGYSGISLRNQEKGYTIVILSNLSTVEQTQLVGELQGVFPRCKLRTS